MTTTTVPTGEKLSGRLANRRTTRSIRHRHAQNALRDTIAHQGELARILRSGNAVALRLEATRRLVLAVLLPALIAFGGWSTAGVQAGAVAMTGAADGSAMWWALWALEPALIAIVAVVVLVRCRLLGVVLEEAAAQTVRTVMIAAERLMWGALGVSLVINTVGHWPADLAGAGGLLFHALGPIGAAATVHLIGVLLEAVEAVPIPAQESIQETPQTVEIDRSRLSERALEIPAGATRLAVVQCCRPARKPRRSIGDQAQRPTQKSTPTDSRKTRADKGTKVPDAAKATPEPVSPRRLSDLDLAVMLQDRIDSQELDSDPTVKAVQESLSIGFERAKRVLALQQERTESVLPGQLSVVEALTQETAAA